MRAGPWVVGAVGVGAALRLWQYAAGGPLVVDEIALARNILERPLPDLLTAPLNYDQAAPPAFLLAVRVTALLLGPADAVLRLVPLLAGLAALLAFRRLAGRVLEGTGPAVALALFAVAAPLILYSGRVKQYSIEVLGAVLLLRAGLDLDERDDRRTAAAAGMLGVLTPWFSHPAALQVVGLWAVVLGRRWWSGRPGRPLALPAAAGIVSAAAAALAARARVTPETLEYLRDYWRDGLRPVPAWRIVESGWPLDQFLRLLGRDGLELPAAAGFLAAAGLGLWLLGRRRPGAAILLATPVAVAVAAAAARQYPLSDKLMLYLLPVLLVGAAEAAERARGWLAGRGPVPGLAVTAAVVGWAAWPLVSTPPPWRQHDVAPALARLQAERRPEDPLYVYYGAVPAIAHYADRYGLGPFLSGRCHRGRDRSYLEEVDALRGHRQAWVLIGHAAVWERAAIRAYLDTIGIRRQVWVTRPSLVGEHPMPVELVVYDLSDPVRLGRATAASFPLGPQQMLTRGFSCRRGPMAMVP